MAGIYWSVVDTCFGWVALIGREGKLIGVDLPKSSKSAAIEGIPLSAEESVERFGELPEQMKAYFSGEPVMFDCDVDIDGVGPFEKRVLLETMKIPFGKVTTYRSLASAVGSPGAARAVGNAMRRNPLPIIVPCHRVLQSDGSLGGFSAGLDMKHRLLMLEGVEL